MDEYVLERVVVKFEETLNYLHWDIVIHYNHKTRAGVGATNFCELHTLKEEMSKRKAIKEAVKLGGERARRNGKLRILFDAEDGQKMMDWYYSVKLMQKMGD